MKKLLLLLLSVALMFSLVACSSATTSSEDDRTEPSAETSAVSEVASDFNSTTEPEENGHILIAYFSWSGNTEQMAQMIQSETGGDLFEIEPEEPYTDDYDVLLDIAQQEQTENARPALAAQVDNWENYDTVFVGYPDWWSDAPMIIYSFLESYDWSGKELVPFCTSGGSGFGRSLDKISASASGAEILEGLHVSGSGVSAADDEISDWISSLNLA